MGYTLEVVNNPELYLKVQVDIKNHICFRIETGVVFSGDIFSVAFS